MTLTEFGVQFDILYNNISSNQAPGLSEYEKSVFLTQAQEAIILDLYKGTAGDSFETTEEVTRYLSSLVKSARILQSEGIVVDNLGVTKTTFSLPDDLLFITYQTALCDNKTLLVVPTRQDSFFKDLNNPFKGPNNNRVLSLSEKTNVILYSKDSITAYMIKYLSKPYPIILEGAYDESNLTINSQIESKEVDWLPESLHTQILLRAVQIAKAVWQS